MQGPWKYLIFQVHELFGPQVNKVLRTEFVAKQYITKDKRTFRTLFIMGRFVLI